MTDTTTNEAPKRKKRDPADLAKSWETRRKNKAKAERAAKKAAKATKPKKPKAAKKATKPRSKPKGEPQSLGKTLSGLLIASRLAGEVMGGKKSTKKLTRSQIAKAAWAERKRKATEDAEYDNNIRKAFAKVAPLQVDEAAVNRMLAEDQVASPAPSRFDVLTEQFLEVAGSNNRDSHRESVHRLLRQTLYDEHYKGEDEAFRMAREQNASRMICEMLADHQIYKRLRSSYSPFMMPAATSDAIVAVLQSLGYSARGRTSRDAPDTASDVRKAT